MNACILVLALAVAAQAQFEPAKCDWEKEMVCPGMWDSETGKQTSPDTCMPMKNGDCMNHCPVDCGKDMLCPGKMDPNGCKMPDACAPGKFCPAECGEKEMMCPGKWNEDWTEQMSGDYCIPNKNGDCVNHCPMDCGKDMLCPGKMDPKGCKMPDTCVPGKFCPAECDGEKELMCPGKWNEDWTEQMSGDYCIPNKNGDCWNTCPMDCGKDTICPGGMDPKGCPMPDTCMPAGNECPKM